MGPDFESELELELEVESDLDSPDVSEVDLAGPSLRPFDADDSLFSLLLAASLAPALPVSLLDSDAISESESEFWELSVLLESDFLESVT